MRIQTDYPYKTAGTPFHSAKVTLVLDETEESTIQWSKDPASYGKAYRKENEDFALSKVSKISNESISIEIDELRYEEPYDQELMHMVIERAIQRGLEKMVSQPGIAHNGGRRSPLSQRSHEY